MGKESYIKPLTYLMVAVAAVICSSSVYSLPLVALDGPFLILAFITIAFGSRLTIQIPRAKVHISVSDPLIFSVLLVYGGQVAVLVAAAEACYASLKFRQKGVFIRLDGILFNIALMASSTFLTSQVLTAFFGSNFDLIRSNSSVFIIALCTMALVQYIANSGLAAVYTAWEHNAPVWHTWTTHYFPASATYVVGAAVAGVFVRLIGAVGFYSTLMTVPVIAIVYFTHKRYIDDIKASSAQAEQSEHDRAEAERERAEAEHRRAEVERERAEQAEIHVGELNQHIAEQQRTSKELEVSKERFRYAAYHDALTGLPNRAHFIELLQLSLTHPGRHQDHCFAVLFLDLDRFKNINDSLGHSSGDQLLIAIAGRLRSCMRQSDLVARFGGDEFAVLLSGINDVRDVYHIVDKIQQELAVPLKIDHHEAFTTASIGIALSSTGYDCPEDVLRDADTAMYRAKEGGKARHEVFNKEMHARAISLMRTESDLRHAVKREELRVFYQPIISLKTGGLAGFEALVRWQHSELGLISPAEFIPVAEDTGLIIPIGRWVLEESCRQMHEWQQQSPAHQDLTLSVNLSGKQLAQPDLIEQVEEVLRNTGFDPRNLKLEITESVVMENAEQATMLLKRLRDLGLQLSIDDFGTGYSSLSYLHRFPVNILKVDRSFVSRMNLNDENLEIVRTILTLAHNLGMEVVAEGVETEEQCVQLKTLKCEYGQGYLFSKPLDQESAHAFIQQSRRAPNVFYTIDVRQMEGFEQTGSHLIM
ncbi:MAG: EAL domain-containing protein [Acidobacteriota bacterium]|nr:EAL domain-containing protein [Acidobacteriota bacterium]